MTTALLIVDMQNAFCSPTGSFARRGGRVEELERVIAGCNRLVSIAKTSNWLVVYTCLTFHQDYRDAGLLVADNPMIREFEAYVDGTTDAEIIDELRPLPAGAEVLRKTRYDPFCGTDLEKMLRARQIEDVIVCGVMTNVCVESTVRRAYDLDFAVRVVVDAVSAADLGQHAASLETMSRHFATLVTVDRLSCDPVAAA